MPEDYSIYTDRELEDVARDLIEANEPIKRSLFIEIVKRWQNECIFHEHVENEIEIVTAKLRSIC